MKLQTAILTQNKQNNRH